MNFTSRKILNSIFCFSFIFILFFSVFLLLPQKASALAIGDSFEGGKVAYILQEGDPGYVEGEVHGLITAPSDQSSGAYWGCWGTEISGADGTAIGTGNQNTIDIMAGCATAGIAARIAGDLELGGYSDWYLPSKDELNKLYLNKDVIGGFSSVYYWSSSETSANNAWGQDFDGGYQGDMEKSNAVYVRAIRSFTIIITAPAQVTGLSATAVSTSQIDLSWTAPDNGGSDITGYKIERESPTGNGFDILVADTGNTDITYSDTSLDPETEYNYKVSAINAIGTGDPSDPDSAITDSLESTYFVTTWKTDNAGTSNSTSITIPTTGAGYLYDVDWDNDGTFDQIGLTGNVTHDFGEVGTYTIRIRGDFPRIYFNNGGDKQKILSVDQWGSIAWSSMANAFDGCTDLVIDTSDAPDLTTVTDMSYMFYNATYFNGDLSSWNVSHVTNMSGLFNNATSFDQPLNSWDVSNVTNMSQMFDNATSFNQDISSWDVSNVTNMSQMFRVSHFNQNISTWNVSSVTNMMNMFAGDAYFNQNISSWNVSNVTNMQGLFWVALSFDQDLSSWNVANVASMTNMFDGATLSAENYDAILAAWSLLPLKSNVVFNGGNSHYCSSATQRQNIITNFSWAINDGGLDCTGVPDTTSFITTWKTDNAGTSNSTSITIPTTGAGYLYDVDWDNDGTFDQIGLTGNVTHDFGVAGTYTIQIRGDFPRIYFANTGDKAKILSVDQWGSISWSSMFWAFGGCSNLEINATDAPDLSNVTDMTYMFDSATSFNQDISAWDVSNVINMDGMFNNATSFDQDLSDWNISSVTNVTNMFLNVTLSTENYDAILDAWSQLTLQEDLTFNGGNSTYCNSATQRQNIIDDFSWTITDGGIECPDLPFITTWKTDNPGTSNSTSITIPTTGAGYLYDVDWDDDGVFEETGLTGNVTHDFGVAGTYTIQIRGDFPRIYFNDSDDKQKILSVDQMGSIAWSSMAYAFMGCSNLEVNATDAPDLSNVTSMSRMFAGATSFDQDISSWGVSNVTDMSFMFELATSFNQDISGWNVSNVIDMSNMFNRATSFNQDLSDWDVSKVTNMAAMFYTDTSFNQDISTWDVSNVIDMRWMFASATSFDQDLSNWDVSNVTNMGYMFYLTTLSTSNYDAMLNAWSQLTLKNNVTFDGGNSHYCNSATQRQNIIDDFNWTITDGGLECPPDTTSFITTWKTDNPGTSNSTSITIPTTGAGYLYDVDWDNDGTFDEIGLTGNVTHDFGIAGTYTIRIRGDFPRIYFYNGGFSDKLKILSVDQWGSIAWTSMAYAFSGCSNLEINATDAPDLTLVTDMSYMFSGATSFNQDLSAWDVSNVTNMQAVFNNAISFNQDLSSWDVSNVTNMSVIFYGATSFNQDISIWDVSNVNNMIYMFTSAISFDQDLSDWDVSSVTNMGWMFLNVTLSTSNYDAMLDAWSQLTLQEDVTFSGGNSHYCNSATQRQNIIDDFSWTITDGGLDCSTVPIIPEGDINIVSVSSDEVLGNEISLGNVVSNNRTISTDGRYIAFFSGASNLVADDTNNVADLFVRDTVAGTTERVSLGLNGEELISGISSSLSFSMSSNGQYIVYYVDIAGIDYLYLYNRESGEREAVLSSLDINKLDDTSVAISDNGRYFLLAGSMFIGGFTSVYLYDNVNDELTILAEEETTEVSQLGFISPTISGDGNYAANSRFFVNYDSLSIEVGVIFHNFSTNETKTIVPDIPLAEGEILLNLSPTFSNNGRYLAFFSIVASTDLSTINKFYLTIYDTETGSTSVFLDGLTETIQELGGEMAIFLLSPSISDDGKYVTLSASGYLMLMMGNSNPSETPLIPTYLYDTQNESLLTLFEDLNYGAASISDNGQYITFTSLATNLVSNDTNEVSDVFYMENPLYGPEITPPSLTTLPATNLERTTARLNGEVTNTGGENVTLRGFEYGKTESYGTEVEESGSFEAETFYQNITELECSTTYHYRAYAENSEGRTNGEDVSFETDSCGGGGSGSGNGNPPSNPPPTIPPTTPPVTPLITTPLITTPEITEVTPEVTPENPPTLPPDNITPEENTSPNNENQNSNSDSDNNSNNSKAFKEVSKVITNSFNEVAQLTQETRKEIAKIIETPTGNVITKTTAVVGVVSGASVGVATALFANPLSVSEIVLIPIRLWTLLLSALGIRRKNKPWGTVYDSVTKQPLDPVYVILQDLNGKEIATCITDLDGRYGFMVPPGQYRMIANKANYQFPSEKLNGHYEDELYHDLYFDQIIEVNEGGVIAKNIPMDPLKFDWNEFAKKDQHRMKFFSQRNVVIAKISTVLFFIGFAITTIALAVAFVFYNIATFLAYGIIYVLKKTILKPKAFGSIKQKDTGNPLSFAIIRVFYPESNQEVLHKVTDKLGKYYCLIPNGTYYAKIEKKNDDGSYSSIYQSEPINVTKGILNIKFEV